MTGTHHKSYPVEKVGNPMSKPGAKALRSACRRVPHSFPAAAGLR
jgi:hypothetical protein